MSENQPSGRRGAASPKTGKSRLTENYFIVSADCHVNEPADLWATRIDPRFRGRIPRVETDANGQKWSVAEGLRPVRIRDFPREATQGQAFALEPHDLELANRGSADPRERIRHAELDGIDAEVIYPNKGLLMWTSPDHALCHAMCRVWNDWARETFVGYEARMAPVAAISPGDVGTAVKEVEWAAKQGFRTVFLPVQVEGLPYNLPSYDPLWAAIEETGLPISMHVGTGRDPREATGNGGAVINYVVHALSSAMEPIAQLCASGVCERFPRLEFVTVEAGIGWLAWTLWAMDEAYVKHAHFVSPKLPMKPSDYFRRQGFATFSDDPMGIETRGWIGVERLMFGNDYPHLEGTWPNSAEVIERTMGQCGEQERRRILGENAAALYGFPIPA